MQRARQAMAENNLQAAEVLIAQAERLDVDYGPLPFGDTPKKARRDLERRLEASKGPSGGAGPTFPLLAGTRKPTPTDPFAAEAHRFSRTGDEARPGPGPNPAVTRLPSVDPVADALPGAVPAGTPNHALLNPSDGNRAESDQLLLAARKALAVGDLRRATARVEQARALNVPYRSNEDSPDTIQRLIAAYGDLMSHRAQSGESEAYRRQLARLLLEQAEGMLRWREYDEAERLANEAVQCRVTYGPFEARPETFFERLRAVRAQDRAATGPAFTAEFAPSGTATGPASSLAAKQRVAQWLRQARLALGSGDLRQAEQCVREAEAMQVPDSAFGPGEDRPGLVRLEIQKARLRAPSGFAASGAQFVMPAGGEADLGRQAAPAVYDPSNDPTRNVLANAQQPPVPPPVPPPAPQAGAPVGATGMQLFQQGEAALRAHDHPSAMRLFRQAAAHMHELDPVTAQSLQDRLQFLSASAPAQPTAPADRSMAEDAAAKQQILARQMMAEVAQRESAAAKQRETDPKGALALLEQARLKVESAGLEPAARDQLLRRIDRSVADTRKYIEDNRPRIELDEQNQRVRQELQRQQQNTLDVQQKVAMMVEEYNSLMREQRWAEAEVVAKRAAELDPTNPVTQQIKLTSTFVRNFQNSMAIKEGKERGFVEAMNSVDLASTPFNDNVPIVFPSAKEWNALTQSRLRRTQESRRRRSERELEIQRKLKTPVLLQYENVPLSRVMDTLGKLAGVNVHLDPQGLAEEGASSDTPVTITLSQEVSLQSALNLILQPLHLSYVIKDEVLKITSEQLRSGEVYTETYSVADLIVPIPNFVPSTGMGLAGALHDAYGSVGFNQAAGPFGGGASPMAVLASRDGSRASGAIHPSVLAQVSGGGPASTPGKSMPLGFGPGGLGGGVMADFDSLIDLITTTVRPTTWDAVGGPGSIAPFETNLSLVVSQTQEVHEEIVDLLEQLRRMQDLQVTIEVRFITLNDNFFERIGVDFDFDVVDGIEHPGMIFGRKVTADDPVTGTPGVRDLLDHARDPTSATVGLSSPGVFSADLDIPFTQNSYTLAVPQFGGFDATAGAQLGFAILSDIEAFFFINAAQGDRRSNVLQAPKVTLFNGSTATVSDTSSSPFVISVIPVVGDFAAAQQPVIAVLNEGTFLSVQAVVSNDRRFVRLTVVPFFSQIDKVDTFQFTGSETTTTDESAEGVQDQPNDNTKKSSKRETRREGTTVQLPTFSFITVTTTVSVPDGGTVLLGGIKRLSEGRNEFGVPILNKIPYINRLFKNVGIGRETQSLMMMVTPRIIIQEEEEERLGILP